MRSKRIKSSLLPSDWGPFCLISGVSIHGEYPLWRAPFPEASLRIYFLTSHFLSLPLRRTCFPVFQFSGPSAALPHMAEGNRWVIIMRKKANGGHAEGKCSSVASCPGNTKPPLVIHCTHTTNPSVTSKACGWLE